MIGRASRMMQHTTYFPIGPIGQPANPPERSAAGGLGVSSECRPVIGMATCLQAQAPHSPYTGVRNVDQLKF